MGAPDGYIKLPFGVACRCLKMRQDSTGSHWCCGDYIGMTPPTSNPSAMSQELSGDKLREHLSVKPKNWHAFKSLTQDEVYLAVENLLATRTALLSAQRKNEELVRALPLIIDARESAAQLVDFLDDMIEPLELSGADEQGYAARWGRYHSANQALTDAIRSISEEK